MDAAEHPLASETPKQDPIDELISELVAIRRWSPDVVEKTVREWADGRESVGNNAVSGALVDVLHMFTEKGRDSRILAYAFLFLLNKCPHSMEDVAALIGCTRAAISKEKRILEGLLGIQSRVSVDEDARESRAQACADRGQKKPRNQAWKGAQYFTNP